MSEPNITEIVRDKYAKAALRVTGGEGGCCGSVSSRSGCDPVTGNLYAAEDGAIGVTELLIRDAGFQPVSVGGLGSARMLEEHLGLMMAINEGGLGRFFYRYARPGEL